jgi:hypothetical protein
VACHPAPAASCPLLPTPANDAARLPFMLKAIVIVP